MSQTDLISVSEAAALRGITPHGIRALIHRGNLPARKIGKQWVINRVALESLKPRRKE
jgi:excisionase family DNA binding protein